MSETKPTFIIDWGPPNRSDLLFNLVTRRITQEQFDEGMAIIARYEEKYERQELARLKAKYEGEQA
jgi:hypothetical protein